MNSIDFKNYKRNLIVFVFLIIGISKIPMILNIKNIQKKVHGRFGIVGITKIQTIPRIPNERIEVVRIRRTPKDAKDSNYFKDSTKTQLEFLNPWNSNDLNDSKTSTVPH